ncbi:MAG: cytochrome c1 [Thiotrichales bacterium]|jgi:ubiquinol-cytochrome c reductase cytochrome c1 subunit|nr:cytochrome c1 [Thiotrichales bacterium]MBT3613682.1 cytochrome c1 [Thiotrichales bacterium]MBT3753197.1 cytochrome c1 [Thiotrichales bacterium]MBT3837733.1 cytochrome c1 [Thiotrichales bacterium]MBT4152419.1 cytochrome c1 [Thiotrichales bacterium]
MNMIIQKLLQKSFGALPKALLVSASLLTMPLTAQASGGADLDHVEIDLSDTESLKNGAKVFMDYCLSCHSAKYMRFKRMADDLGMTDEEVLENLVYSDAKIHDTMEIAMPEADAALWFGAAPPDLSVVSRSRGADWLYTYLRSFYVDKSRPMGVNNLVFKDVGMPHVLWKLQGMQHIEESKTNMAYGKEKIEHKLVADGTGSMSTEEYDKTVSDLVNFLVYVGEPIRSYRESLGLYVLGFLLILLVLTIKLKKEYWKDVH